MTQYESFCDENYYGLWAVRAVGEKRWGYAFHVQTQAEAEGLRDRLNRLERELAEAKAKTKEAMNVITDVISERNQFKAKLKHYEEGYRSGEGI